MIQISLLDLIICIAIVGVLGWTVYKIICPPKAGSPHGMEVSTWFYIGISGIIISILSLFLPVILLTGTEWGDFAWNIIDIAGGSSEFNEEFVEAYTGPVVLNISDAGAVVLAIIAVAAVICAAVGLVTLRSQRPNTWQFVMTVIGLIGVAVPSIVVLVIVYGYGDYFYGDVSCGLAPFLTPAAMIVCIVAVVRRHSRVKTKLRLEMEQKGMIRQGGDL